MSEHLNTTLFAKIGALLLLALIAMYGISAITSMEERYHDLKASKMEKAIDDALNQCYALEGAYPSNENFLTKLEKYGITINQDKYICHYESLNPSVKPVVKVVFRH